MTGTQWRPTARAVGTAKGCVSQQKETVAVARMLPVDR